MRPRIWINKCSTADPLPPPHPAFTRKYLHLHPSIRSDTKPHALASIDAGIHTNSFDEYIPRGLCSTHPHSLKPKDRNKCGDSVGLPSLGKDPTQKRGMGRLWYCTDVWFQKSHGVESSVSPRTLLGRKLVFRGIIEGCMKGEWGTLLSFLALFSLRGFLVDS